MATKDIILHGLAWRVGNGRKNSIWHDKWLPSLNYLKIISDTYPGLDLATIATLLYDDGKSWNESLLNLLFSLEECNLIKNIPW